MFGFGIRSRPSFDIRYNREPSETLVVGYSEMGLAGMTAVDYLVTQLDLEEVGHIRVDSLPAITPFQAGTPRHHTRLYSRDDVDLTVLVGELFLPSWAADAFAEAVVEWTERHDVAETVALSGVPVTHGPEEHRPYYIATEDYQRAHRSKLGLDAEHSPTPMGGGYLDGLNGALIGHGMHTEQGACVLTTPVHSQTPDADAALRLLSALDFVYELDLDVEPLQTFAARVSKHYEELAERMAEAEEEAAETTPEDRMYM